jgi:hypothetical protein
MKALSIRNPWAAAIIHLGKDVENRTWMTTYRGPVLIHTGKILELDEFGSFWLRQFPGLKVTREFIDLAEVKGGIIGQGDIVDCVTSSTSKWFTGPYGFVLANVKPLPFRACHGMLGLFEPQFGD